MTKADPQSWPGASPAVGAVSYLLALAGVLEVALAPAERHAFGDQFQRPFEARHCARPELGIDARGLHQFAQRAEPAEPVTSAQKVAPRATAPRASHPRRAKPSSPSAKPSTPPSPPTTLSPPTSPTPSPSSPPNPPPSAPLAATSSASPPATTPTHPRTSPRSSPKSSPPSSSPSAPSRPPPPPPPHDPLSPWVDGVRAPKKRLGYSLRK